MVVNPGNQQIPSALDDQMAAMAKEQLQNWLTTKAEGHSILNYNLANKQYLDALSLGRLLGVDTSRVRPYGGESHQTVNVIGTDAIDGIARRVVAEQQAQQAAQQPVHTQQDPQSKPPQVPPQPPPTNGQPGTSQTGGSPVTGGGTPGSGTGQTGGTDPTDTSPSGSSSADTPKKSNLLRNIALGTGLVLGGMAIPPIVGALINGDEEEQVDQEQTDIKVPWHQGAGEGKVEVDVY
jgi:hypothetical protein